MAIYQPILNDVVAAKWNGHGDPDYDLDDYPIRRNPGATGYNGKLGYINVKGQNPVIVRPKDYVIVDGPGKIRTMIASDFEAKYCPKVEKEAKTANNDKKPATKADNAKVDEPI